MKPLGRDEGQLLGSPELDCDLSVCLDRTETMGAKSIRSARLPGTVAVQSPADREATGGVCYA